MNKQESEQDQKPEMSTHKMEKPNAKYPLVIRSSTAGRALGENSAFLQKKIGKGQKFFDSGDYEMSKKELKVSGPLNWYATGEAIPTPETVSVRKGPVMQPSKFKPSAD